MADQLLLTADANKALLVPRLVPVVHSSGGDGLNGVTHGLRLLEILMLTVAFSGIGRKPNIAFETNIGEGT